MTRAGGIDEDLDDLLLPEVAVAGGVGGPDVGVGALEADIEVVLIPEDPRDGRLIGASGREDDLLQREGLGATPGGLIELAIDGDRLVREARHALRGRGDGVGEDPAEKVAEYLVLEIGAREERAPDVDDPPRRERAAAVLDQGRAVAIVLAGGVVEGEDRRVDVARADSIGHGTPALIGRHVGG